MKKYIIMFIFIIILTGCGKKKVVCRIEDTNEEIDYLEKAEMIGYLDNDDKVYNIGKEKIKTKCGNNVMCYNLERTICDLIRSVKRLNEHDVNIMVKRYLKDKNCNLDRLYDYAKKMNIYDEVYKMTNKEK